MHHDINGAQSEPSHSAPLWSRRTWLQHNAIGVAAVAAPAIIRPHGSAISPETRARAKAHAVRADPAPWQALTKHAVAAAGSAGAQYADARIIRTVVHKYSVAAGEDGLPRFRSDDEQIGLGVRALFNGYWGFSASTVITMDEAVRLAVDAVGQAKENAKGPAWTVDLGSVPVVQGAWTTPHRIDPFSVPIEEKQDAIGYWKQCAIKSGVLLRASGFPSSLRFVRQERVVATSEGSSFVQTLFESSGWILTTLQGEGVTQPVHDIDVTGTGWELLLDANIPEQFLSGRIRQELKQKEAVASKPAIVGKYTLVCDGATMGRLVEGTFGVATQLDRAFGYEANGAGGSFFDDPLGMLGTYQAASPLVTVTANRSAPRELATVKWDDEGVTTDAFPLLKTGVLVDFPTTRERAGWLAPYYAKTNQPQRSHGCATSADAHGAPVSLMPNLALEPAPSSIRLEDLVADVQNGILIEDGIVGQIDSQAKTGMLDGKMRQITNGRLGKALEGCCVLWTSKDIWNRVRAIGGPASQVVVGTSTFSMSAVLGGAAGADIVMASRAGQPPQVTSRSIRAVAATITDQAVIDPHRRA